MMSHYEDRMREIARARQRGREALLRRTAHRAPVPRQIKADSKALLHIAACLRRSGMVRFADVIERAANELAKHETK
jgi:hypothetical protein